MEAIKRTRFSQKHQIHHTQKQQFSTVNIISSFFKLNLQSFQFFNPFKNTTLPPTYLPKCIPLPSSLPPPLSSLSPPASHWTNSSPPATKFAARSPAAATRNRQFSPSPRVRRTQPHARATATPTARACPSSSAWSTITSSACYTPALRPTSRRRPAPT